jgi:AraC-like DNA-binding protein
MYSGYIVHCLYLVDFSETFALLIGPFFYLHVRSLIQQPVDRRYGWHFLFPFIYLLLQLPFLLLPEDAKYNAWIFAYHPDLPFRDFVMPYDPKILFVTDHHAEVVVLSLLFYGILSCRAVIEAFREKGEPFWKTDHPVLTKLRSGVIQILSGLVIIVTIKLLYQKDLGDHFLAAYISLTIYITSFSVVGSSVFFKSPTLEDSGKYKGSSLTSAQRDEILRRVTGIMEKDLPFVRLDFSLPDLARLVNVSVHTLSQVINEGTGKTFFEWTAVYRVEAARRLLKEHPEFKMEEIAERVGYSSKSSFNTAFKKLTGKTPSEYRSG